MKKFSWQLYVSNNLEENYENIEYKNNEYRVNNNLCLYKDKTQCFLEKKSEDYEIIIDFLNKVCKIKMLKENLYTEFEVPEIEIIDKKNKIIIMYKLDDEINKIVIDLKE